VVASGESLASQLNENHVTHTNIRQEQHHKRPHEGPPLHLTTIEANAATVRTTSHTRVGFGPQLNPKAKSESRARDSRASSVEGGTDGCEARALSA